MQQLVDLLWKFSLENFKYVPNYTVSRLRNLLVYNVTGGNNCYTVP
jgi:hypothetical protein